MAGNKSIIAFQFHKGAIRTDVVGITLHVVALFQFHKGAIRTEIEDAFLLAELHFNSIKVRLEHSSLW